MKPSVLVIGAAKSGVAVAKLLNRHGYAVIITDKMCIRDRDEDTYTLVAILDKSRKGIGNVPAYVKNVDKTARLLAPKLDMKEDSIRDILQNAIDNKQYQTELGTKGKNLSKSVKESIEALELSLIHILLMIWSLRIPRR